jgi:hypothetical protein
MKSQCWTFRIEQVLREENDFLTIEEIISKIPSMNRNQALAALHHLRVHKVVDFLKQSRVTFWYPLSEEEDTRKRIIEERKEEEQCRQRKNGFKYPQGIRRLGKSRYLTTSGMCYSTLKEAIRRSI